MGKKSNPPATLCFLFTEGSIYQGGGGKEASKHRAACWVALHSSSVPTAEGSGCRAKGGVAIPLPPLPSLQDDGGCSDLAGNY